MRLSGNFGRGCDSDILSPPSMKEEKQDYHTENSTNKSRTVIVGCLFVCFSTPSRKEEVDEYTECGCSAARGIGIVKWGNSVFLNFQ